jgi:hypothetical protein
MRLSCLSKGLGFLGIRLQTGSHHDVSDRELAFGLVHDDVPLMRVFI